MEVLKIIRNVNRLPLSQQMPVAERIIHSVRFLLITLIFFTSLSYAQDRNFKLVKTPTKNVTKEKRKAVVIGMSDYGAGKSLNNTLNDADDMANVLTQLGFKVTLLKNNDLRGLRKNLTDWYNTIEGNDMAIFYFAGHGMEVSGENYLIPVDAALNSQTDVQYSALNVNQVLGNMDEKHVGMKLLILDACRDNPFKRSWNRGDEGKGLAQMAAPKGTFIAFAAAPGATAIDGGSYNLRNGVFTHYLKQEIVKEGISIDHIFTNVSRDVANLTNNTQAPFRNSSLTDIFYFKPIRNTRPGDSLTKYYYYVDQNGNESQNRFNDRKTAENEMKKLNLYGKIYSNAGEVFVVDKPNIPFNNYTETINNLNIEMVAVQKGVFTMGCTSEQGGDCNDSEKPAHRVTLSAFYIGKYEVTQAQWKTVMGDNPSFFKGDNYPVDNVNWNEVQTFITKLNNMTDKHYRLPTEAEWEYAARGGVSSKDYKFSGGNTVGDIAWYWDNSNSRTHTVGEKPANESGIHDMSGNVWEWCSDWYGSYSNSVQMNPTGASSGSYRVNRGGGWSNDEKNVRVSHRNRSTPNARSNSLGFRLACSVQ